MLERSELSVSPALRNRGVAQHLRSLGNFGDAQGTLIRMGNAGSFHFFASVPCLDDIAEAAEAVRSLSVYGVDGDPECSSVNSESCSKLFGTVLALVDPVARRRGEIADRLFSAFPHVVILV